MNKKFRISLILSLALASLPACGAWTDGQATVDRDDAYIAEVTDADQVRYIGGQPIGLYATEQINYVSKVIVEDIYTDGDAPEYYDNSADMTNSCGAVSGSIAVGFYDKYYSNMIPDWDSYYPSGIYRKQDSEHVGALKRDLYARMQTNVYGDGVTEDDFKNGLSSYINERGYNVSYSSVGSKGSFNYNLFKEAIRNNQVTVLFTQPSNVYRIGILSNADVVSSTYISGNHIMVAFGYYEVKYIMNGGTRHEIYLRVCTAWGEPSRGFYKVGSYLVDAVTVKIN